MSASTSSRLISLFLLVATVGASAAANARAAAPHPHHRGTYTFYEDRREGFPKIAAYRPSCDMTTSQAASFDWVVTASFCSTVLDPAHARNPRLLGMIQPGIRRTGLLLAASYGAYDRVTASLAHPAIGSVRAFQPSDWLQDTAGGAHRYGTVNVLNLLSADTAVWSADVAAYWARWNGALDRRHPGVMGVWGDNDLWADQGYAYTGTALDPQAVGAATAAANQRIWDTNFVLRHMRLARDLPGMIIGGNDISSYSKNPARYKGRIANGWLLPHISSAGMRECAEDYQGLYTADGVDTLIASAQRFLASKKLDGKQRYLMLNNCHADSTQTNEYSLAVATIGGYYYWPYTQSGFWKSTLSIAPAIPDYTHNGARHWLGFPTAAPQKLASGLWKRTFQHGTVYVNMTGSTHVVDGREIQNQTGLFAVR